MKTKILILELSSNKTHAQKQTSTHFKTRSHFFPYYQKKTERKRISTPFPFLAHSHFPSLRFPFLLQQYFTQSFLDVKECRDTTSSSIFFPSVFHFLLFLAFPLNQTRRNQHRRFHFHSTRHFQYSNKNRKKSANLKKTVHVLVLSTPYLIHLFFFIFYSSGSKNFSSYLFPN